MKVKYIRIDGEVVHENRSGVQHGYVPDSLGSSVALLSSTQTQTDTSSYWPYGEARTRAGSIGTPFQFVGTVGYYQDSASRKELLLPVSAAPLGRVTMRGIAVAKAITAVHSVGHEPLLPR